MTQSEHAPAPEGRRGKLIVIEGTDGSGKKTQTALLVKRMSEGGKNSAQGSEANVVAGTNDEAAPISTYTTDFPRYGTPSAYFVEKYLHGEYGTAEEVGPYAGSIFYSLDRYDHSKLIKEKLAEGTNVVCDRYTSANMGHQAGKIDDLTKRDEYLAWLENLEFNMLGIPRPDLTILLYVSPETNQKLMANRADKEYLKGKKQDIHEADMKHLKKASEAFLYVAKKYGWKVIDCAPAQGLQGNNSGTLGTGELLSIEQVHEIVWKAVQDMFR